MGNPGEVTQVPKEPGEVENRFRQLETIFQREIPRDSGALVVEELEKLLPVLREPIPEGIFQCPVRNGRILLDDSPVGWGNLSQAPGILLRVVVYVERIDAAASTLNRHSF